ncbi:hypothetical protein JCM8097_002931 [Rhodosporidiobolus ruineniae]
MPSTSPAASLLPELLRLIFNYSLPPPSYTHVSIRLPALCSFSLVCRSWGGPAQQLLWRDVVLPSIDAAQAFLDAARSGERGAELARAVRTLRLGTLEKARRLPEHQLVRHDEFGVLELMERCEYAEEIWVAGMRDLKLEELGVARHLEGAFFFNCAFDCTASPEPDPHPPPTFRRLGLIETSKTLPPYSLDSTRFPQLRVLALLPDGTPQRTTSLSKSSTVFDIDPSMKSQLFACSIDIFTFSRLLLCGYGTDASALQLLDCGCPFVSQSVDDPLKWPTSLRFLRFADLGTGLAYISPPSNAARFVQTRRDAIEHLLWHFQRNSPAVRDLQAITLRATPFDASAECREVEWELGPLEEECRKRGIELEVEAPEETFEERAFELRFWRFVEKAEGILRREDERSHDDVTRRMSVTKLNGS